MHKTWNKLFALLLAIMMMATLTSCNDQLIEMFEPSTTTNPTATQTLPIQNPHSIEDDVIETDIFLPDGSRLAPWDNMNAVVEVNSNQPYFTDEEKSRVDAFETYSELDDLGRCGVAYANICHELMPTEARGEIGNVRPSGWHTVRYNELISGNYLYNRCHLIGFQLAGENANEKNLITGTRYLNIEGMLPYENMVDDYVDDTDNHVLYRVTPVYNGDDLVARGVLMEGWSVEDNGAGICFNVFAYNNQPYIVIDYATGESHEAAGYESTTTSGDTRLYILNTNSGKFHLPECESAKDMAESNRLELEKSLDEMLSAGYSPCGRCHPDK